MVLTKHVMDLHRVFPPCVHQCCQCCILASRAATDSCQQRITSVDPSLNAELILMFQALALKDKRRVMIFAHFFDEPSRILLVTTIIRCDDPDGEYFAAPGASNWQRPMWSAK